MTETVSANVQLNVDTGRKVTGYPSEGYSIADPSELQVRDAADLGFGKVRVLWAPDIADLDEFDLLYVEAVNMPITLVLETLDSIDVAGTTLTMQLVAGLPFMLGSRFVEPLVRISTVTVTGPASVEAGVRFSIAR